SGSDLSGLVLVETISPDFAGPDRPAPHINLGLRAAPKINSAVTCIQNLRLLLLALIVQCEFAIWQNDWMHLFLAFVRPSPITDQNKIAVIFLAPQMLILRFAFAVVLKNPIIRSP